jgi:AraC-like DNA-binding protein
MAHPRRSRDRRPDWLALVPAEELEVDSATSLAATTTVWDQPEFTSHMHAPMEIGILLDGRRQMHFGRRVLHFGPGDVWLCAMWEPHGWLNGPDYRPVHLYFLPAALWDPVDLTPAWPRLFAVPPEHRPRVRSAETRARLLEIGHEVAREVQEQRPGWLRMARLALLRLLLLLEREWQPPNPGGRHAPARPTDLDRIAPALALATANLHRRVGVTEAAGACRLSVSRFHDVFHRTMGVGFRDFALRARLAVVARELLRTNRSVDDLALAAGFTDGSHLHRSFVAEYGLTPARYRRRNRASGVRHPP